LDREEYVAKRQAGLLQPDGCYVKFFNEHGSLESWKKRVVRQQQQVQQLQA
jgi:large subunit ribosomal protein L10e